MVFRITFFYLLFLEWLAERRELRSESGLKELRFRSKPAVKSTVSHCCYATLFLTGDGDEENAKKRRGTGGTRVSVSRGTSHDALICFRRDYALIYTRALIHPSQICLHINTFELQ